VLYAREFQQVIVSRALLGITQDLVGSDDFPESQSGVRIARPDVGVGTLDGSTKCGPETFGVIVWKSPK
jgi:hypothetical protein